MTKAEARERFGIKETDSLDKDGIRQLLQIAEKRAKVWSLTASMREEIAKDIAAYTALLQD